MYSIAHLYGRPCVRGSRFIISSVRRRSKADDTGTTSKVSKDINGKALPKSGGRQPLHLWQRLGPFTKAFNGYGRAQTNRPYVTQVLTSVVIYFCGDLGAQKIGEDAYDPWRAARNMIIGAVVSIPAYNWCSPPLCPTFSGANEYVGSCTLAAPSTMPPSSSQLASKSLSTRSSSRQSSSVPFSVCIPYCQAMDWWRRGTASSGPYRRASSIHVSYGLQ